MSFLTAASCHFYSKSDDQICATFLWTPICFSMLSLFVLVLMLHCFKYYIIYKIIDTNFCKFSILFLTLSLLYRLSLVNDLVNSRTMLSVLLCVFAQSCLTLCDPMDYITLQASPSVRFPRQDYRKELPFISLGGSSALAGRFFTLEPPGKPPTIYITS